MLGTLPIFTPSIQPKKFMGIPLLRLEDTKLWASRANSGNIVQLASAGVNLPKIYAGNPVRVHAVESAKKSVGTPLLRPKQVKLWLQGQNKQNIVKLASAARHGESAALPLPLPQIIAVTVRLPQHHL
jgi:hypothetical protein